jgi:hypothetical protein
MNEIEIRMENFLIERVEPLVEKMAGAMEPLAESMEALADDTRKVLNQTQEQARLRNKEWAEQQGTITRQWNQISRRLEHQIGAATKAGRDVTWRLWVMALAAALIVSVAAPSVYALWQRNYSKSAKELEEAAAGWQWVLERRQELSAKDRKIVDKLLYLQGGG